MDNISEQLLRALLQTSGRGTFSEDDLLGIIGNSEKNKKAYQLCDGMKNQGEIAKLAKIDSGNFSRSLTKWEEAGIVFKIGAVAETRPLHIYPLSKEAFKKEKK
ncbi:MAG: MarR family transcriptional regulator [Proteobacteria bacterium]|nr:MarR family transcriptional regulator [Pseudomonadota bacterium]